MNKKYLYKIWGLIALITFPLHLLKSIYFKFNNKTYKYFYSLKNTTWFSERCIEIPIFKKMINKFKNKRILEVGNVLNQYTKINHLVIDKYEKNKNILNIDIVNFKPKHKFDLIICISTIEHIGYNENIYTEKKNILKPNKHLKVLKLFKKWLKPKGKAFISFSLGYNKFLDYNLHYNKLPFTKTYYLKKISLNGKWKQFKYNKVSHIRYNNPYYNSNVVCIGIIEK